MACCLDPSFFAVLTCGATRLPECVQANLQTWEGVSDDEQNVWCELVCYCQGQSLESLAFVLQLSAKENVSFAPPSPTCLDFARAKRWSNDMSNWEKKLLRRLIVLTRDQIAAAVFGVRKSPWTYNMFFWFSVAFASFS